MAALIGSAQMQQQANKSSSPNCELGSDPSGERHHHELAASPAVVSTSGETEQQQLTATNGENINNKSQQADDTSDMIMSLQQYDVEHLATFVLLAPASTNGQPNGDDQTTTSTTNAMQLGNGGPDSGYNHDKSCKTTTAINDKLPAIATASEDHRNENHNQHDNCHPDNVDEVVDKQASSSIHLVAPFECENDDNGNNRSSKRHQQQQNGVDANCVASSRRQRRSSDLKASSADDALERLFALEKLSGIWTQQMKLELKATASTNNPIAASSSASDANLNCKQSLAGHEQHQLIIVDCETESQLETFEVSQVEQVRAFKQYNDIYNNILLFIIAKRTSASGHDPAEVRQSEHHSSTSREIHIFQCISDEAETIKKNIEAFKNLACDNQIDRRKPEQEVEMAPKAREQNAKTPSSTNTNRQQSEDHTASSNQSDRSKRSMSNAESNGADNSGNSNACKPMITVASSKPESSRTADPVPLVNVNVKETVQVFNQIAAQREKSKSSSPVAGQQLAASTSAGANNSHASSGNNNNIGTQQHGIDQLASQSGRIKQNRAANSSPPGVAGDLGENVAFHQQLFKQHSIRARLAPLQSRSQSESANQPTGQSNNNSVEQPLQNNNHIRQSTHSASSSSSANASDATATNNNNKSHKTITGSASSGPKSNQHHGQKSDGNRLSAPTTTTKSGPTTTTSQNGDSNPLLDGGGAKASKGFGNKTSPHHNNINNNNIDGKHLEPSHQRSQTTKSLSGASSSSPEQVTTNESYVSVLNHCFDDIEKFILRLQHSVTAHRELQAKRKLSRRAASQLNQLTSSRLQAASTSSSATLAMIATTGANSQVHYGDTSAGSGPIITNVELAMLAAKARGPSVEDYFEILSKFKLAFNLLAKLKGCIHDPNAPELVHFLFTPLTIIIESARNASPPIDPTLVGIPYLNQDALDLLSNCCTSKESDMWLSLGPNWTQTIDLNLLKVSRLPSSFQPVFSDGWAPVIGELELIGLVVPPTMAPGSSSSSSSATSGGGASCPSQAKHIKNNRKLMSSSRHYLNSPPTLTNDDDQLIIHNNSGTKNGDLLGKSKLTRSQHHLNGIPSNPVRIAKDDQAKKRNGSITHVFESTNRLDYDTNQQTHNIKQAYGYNQVLDRGHQRGDHFRNGANMDDSARIKAVRTSRSSKYQHQQHQSDLLHPNNLDRLQYDDQDLLEPSDFIEPDYMGINGGAINHKGRMQQTYQSNIYDDSDYGPVDGVDALVPPYTIENYRAPGYMGAAQANHHPVRQSSDILHSPPNLIRRYTQTSANIDRHHSRYEHLKGVGTGGGPSDMYSVDDIDGSGYLDEADQEAMLLDLGPAQTEWFFELQSRGAMIVRVLFTREANNEKELSVRRGELLEILDNSRRWWRGRNIDLEVAFVPHTIVAPMQNYQTLDDLLISNSDLDAENPLQAAQSMAIMQGHGVGPPIHRKAHHGTSRQLNGRYSHREDLHNQGRIPAQHVNPQQLPHQGSQHSQLVKNSSSGPFRYF